MIEIYTDGGCKGNPGPGGWSAVVIKDKEIIDIFYGEDSATTNNRMEITGMMYALNYVIDLDEPVTIYSDSAYVVNMCKDWIWNWSEHNWKNSRGVQVENLDLVCILFSILQEVNFCDYKIVKIKGHSGSIGNELADAAATGNWKKYNTFKSKLTN